MARPQDPRRGADRTLLVLLLAILLLSPPLLNGWADPAHPWYLPYLVWGALVALTAAVAWWSDRA